MRKRYKTGLVIISILLLLVISVGVFKIFFGKEEEKPKNTTNVVSSIEKYNYTLDDRDSTYMKDTFEKLRSILSEEKVDEEAYANTLAKLFIIDFYTLNNKINKYDVGSLEYILSSKREEFKNKAMDTMYNDIIDNTYKDRIQSLPEITNVEIIENTLTTFEVKEEKYEAYKITMKYSYKEDLGYDSEGTIYLAKVKDKLEVVNYKPAIEEN